MFLIYVFEFSHSIVGLDSLTVLWVRNDQPSLTDEHQRGVRDEMVFHQDNKGAHLSDLAGCYLSSPALPLQTRVRFPELKHWMASTQGYHNNGE